MKYLILILAMTFFVSCNKDDVDPREDCWEVVHVICWTNLPSGSRGCEITIRKGGVAKTIRKMGYKVGDYYCD